MNLKHSTLKKRAENNMSIKRGKEEVKKGVPFEHSQKHGVPIQARTVGMNKGITRNMGDFESLRVDVWLTDYVGENETHEEALERVESIVDDVLENAVMSMVDD